MSSPADVSQDTGLEVTDIRGSAVYAARRPHGRSVADEMAAMQRIAGAFVDKPETILQELVNAAVELCGADSAGVSLEKEDRTEAEYFHWVATAGEYSRFLNAILPKYPSACSICLDRGRPQLFRVGQRFFDIMGISAPLVTDGILLPWEVDGTRGTIFVMAHEREEAFDAADCRLMEVLAEFAAMGVRQEKQQKRLVRQASAAAAAAMANDLAHKINNPLQSLTNTLYLLLEVRGEAYQHALGPQALEDLQRLSSLVKSLLAIPFQHPE